MNRFHLTFFAFVMLSGSLHGFADSELPPTRPLSPSSFISLLTCDPGAELYSIFGHSAIGVSDPEQNLNWVFNYGTFDFNTPHFYAKFASGNLLYNLSVSSREQFLREYENEGRKVLEERLNVTPAQKQRLFDYLKENYEPENRYYRYDFFFDNCSTRIMDILYRALGDSLTYHPPPDAPRQTFRNLLDEYLSQSCWSDFGIDIALGSVIDTPATDRQKAFLPDYLSKYLNRCTIHGEPFITTRYNPVTESHPLPRTPFLIRPDFLFWLLFPAILFLSVKWKDKKWIMADRIFFSALGFVGLIVLLLWLATDHAATAGNLNVLWANPLYLVYVFFIKDTESVILKWMSLAIALMNALVLITWGLNPQQYHPAFIPIIGTIMVRSIFRYRIFAFRLQRNH